VEFAPFGPRLIAYVIDAVIIGVVVTAVVLLAIAVGFASGELVPGQVPSGRGWGALLVGIVVVAFLGLSYFPWFWTRGGATPGMKMFDLRVVRDDDGGPIGLGTAIVRMIGMWASSAVMYVGFIWVFVDKRRRGWHDLIAGTVVVKRG
jgi:uncharacterized RDD family membrane protein YckC